MSETETESRDDEWAAAMAEQAGSEGAEQGGGEAAAGVEAAEMSALVAEPAAGEPGDLDNILDIPVTLSVEIGSTHVSIRNLLQLNQGSVVELDRLAGEPLNVLVNGTLIAHGEVVVVNEKFGIRLTDVVSAQQRVRKLQ